MLLLAWLSNDPLPHTPCRGCTLATVMPYAVGALVSTS